MPTLEQQSIVHQSSIDIRTTVVSSDSVEWRALLRNRPLTSNAQQGPPPTLMNKVNWITYLKILFDQLEKQREPVPILDGDAASSQRGKKSFLSSVNEQLAHGLGGDGRRVEYLETVHRH